MIRIPIPDVSNSSAKVSLAGVTFTFQYTYNSTSKTFYLNVLKSGRLIVAGLKLTEGSLLWNKYALDELSIGEIFVAKLKETEEPVGRDNIGLDKAYELVFIPYQ